MVLLGNFQINGSVAQKNPAITYDTFTDIASLQYSRPGTIKILNLYGFSSWSQADITAKFNKAAQYASNVDYLVFLGEEWYKPSRTPQMSPGTAQGGYSIEGVNIPSPSNEDAYFVALLTAWKKMCVRLGKKAAICGSPAVCSDDAVWPWMYGSPAISYISANYDMIFLYHYPTTLSAAQGSSCIQQNGNSGKNDAKSYIQFWRGKGFNGFINYILTNKFPDFVGTTDYNVVKADFISAAQAGADIISTYAPDDGFYSHSGAVTRMLQIATEYWGAPPPQPIPGGNNMGICIFGDGEPTSAGTLTTNLNKVGSLSPFGIPGIAITTGDMTKSSGTDFQYTLQALAGSNLSGAQKHFVSGNHEYDNKSSAWVLMKSNRGTKYPLTTFSGDGSGLTYHFKTEEGINIFILNIYYNNSTGAVDTPLYNWLAAELAATSGHKIVCLHDPLYPYKYHIGNSLDANPAMRDKLQTLFEAKGVNIVLVGHAHYSNILDKNGVLHVNTGTILIQGTGDSFITANYVHVNSNGNLVLTVINDITGSPKTITKTLGGTTIPPPTPTPPPNGNIVSTSAQLQAALTAGGSFTIKNGSYTLNPVVSPPGTIAIGESKDGVIISSSSTGYLITLKSNSIIDKCTFKHKGKTIFVSGPQINWKVRNNHFVDSVIAVLAEDLTSSYPTAGNGSEISGNTGKGSKLSTIQGQYKLHVFDNEFHDRNGSEFLDINYNNDYCIIENNKLINGSGYTMSEEMIDAVGGNGQGQDNNIIRNNTIIGNFQSGIRLGITTKNNQVEGNYIEWIPGTATQEAGIYCYGKGGSSVPSGNKFLGNTIKGGNCGIKLSNSNNNTITENTISGSLRGIALVADSIYGSDIAPNGNIVSKNTINVSNLANGIISEGLNDIRNDNIITDLEPKKPILISHIPSTVKVGDNITHVVTGQNFDSAANVIVQSIGGLYPDGSTAGKNPIRTATSITWEQRPQGNFPGEFYLYVKNGNGLISDTKLLFIVNPAVGPGPGPVEFGFSNLAKVGLAVAGIYAFIEGLKKK